MRNLLEARRLAGRWQDWEMAGVVSLNLASLYLQTGESSGAIEEVRHALAALDRVPRSRYRAHALALGAKLRSREGDLEGALPAFFAAIQEADSQGDVALKSLVTNQLGYEYLNKGRLADADRAMTEAFRLRILNQDREIGQSYRALGLLRMAQGDLESAGVLLELAVTASQRNPGRVPNWAAYYGRGELRVAQHRPTDALRDYRIALDLARSWRLEVLPADSIRTSAEVELEQLYSSFIRTANALYFSAGRASLAREAFAAAEESRSASLRAALNRDARWRDRLPAAYGQTLAELRLARTVLMQSGSSEARETTGRLRHRLAEMEVRAGLEIAAASEAENAPRLADEIAAAIEPSEALISFYLDEPQSYVWIITRENFEVHRLAGATEIRAVVNAFTESVRRNSSDTTALGQTLYTKLFGRAGRSAQRKRRWLLAVEDVLFGLPFPALVVERRGTDPVFLVERHSITIIPGAVLLRRGSRPDAEAGGVPGNFVGIGDPVYNGADERCRRGGAYETRLQLPRLAGSAREIRLCAQAWTAHGQAASPVLLEGPAANRQTLAGALAAGPGAIHFATHVVRSQESPARRLIPLSLLADGNPDFIGPEDIASWRLRRPAVVVLSGCASGAPERRLLETDKLGLVGLAGAWLSAGARAVAVTLWPTPDDDGELFLSFYRHLGESAGAEPAVALEHAQLDMLNSKTWRSAPKHWAAYLMVGRE